ncbi:putative Ser/Thr phosphatase family protein [Blattamonas nauphoetae]|uniref:Ser/Thr phosphatase family protein n=1 Tax=Blattamonas nauphoetae TaxID=2049346 RepID=A0ABQ9XMA7_9EUKA|nr:putative Ser/Thr phosphatase family protein [Blattamonas nauphoetae]
MERLQNFISSRATISVKIVLSILIRIHSLDNDILSLVESVLDEQDYESCWNHAYYLTTLLFRNQQFIPLLSESSKLVLYLKDRLETTDPDLLNFSIFTCLEYLPNSQDLDISEEVRYPYQNVQNSPLYWINTPNFEDLDSILTDTDKAELQALIIEDTPLDTPQSFHQFSQSEPTQTRQATPPPTQEPPSPSTFLSTHHTPDNTLSLSDTHNLKKEIHRLTRKNAELEQRLHETELKYLSLKQRRTNGLDEGEAVQKLKDGKVFERELGYIRRRMEEDEKEKLKAFSLMNRACITLLDVTRHTATSRDPALRKEKETTPQRNKGRTGKSDAQKSPMHASTWLDEERTELDLSSVEQMLSSEDREHISFAKSMLNPQQPHNKRSHTLQRFVTLSSQMVKEMGAKERSLLKQVVGQDYAHVIEETETALAVDHTSTNTHSTSPLLATLPLILATISTSRVVRSRLTSLTQQLLQEKTEKSALLSDPLRAPLDVRADQVEQDCLRRLTFINAQIDERERENKRLRDERTQMEEDYKQQISAFQHETARMEEECEQSRLRQDTQSAEIERLAETVLQQSKQISTLKHQLSRTKTSEQHLRETNEELSGSLRKEMHENKRLTRSMKRHQTAELEADAETSELSRSAVIISRTCDNSHEDTRKGVAIMPAILIHQMMNSHNLLLSLLSTTLEKMGQDEVSTNLPVCVNLTWLFDSQMAKHPWLWGLFGGLSLIILLCIVLFMGASQQFNSSFFVVASSLGMDILYGFIDLLIPTIVCEIVFAAYKASRHYKLMISGIVVGVVFIWEILGHIPGNFRRKRYVTVHSTKVRSSFRLVHLTDIHMGSLNGGRLAQIAKEVNQLNPDVVCITGDLTDTKRIVQINQPTEDSEKLLPSNAFYPLTQILAPSGVFFVTGNHDLMAGREDLMTILAKCPNVKVLDNTSVVVPITNSETTIKMVGIEDGSAEYFTSVADNICSSVLKNSTVVDRNQIESPVTEQTDPMFTILLHHRPHKRVWRDVMRQLQTDMFLAGHTHAGQLSFMRPLVWFVHRPDVWLSSPDEQDRLINSSKKLFDKPFMYVNPGTGTWGSRKRTSFFDEITIFDISPSVI